VLCITGGIILRWRDTKTGATLWQVPQQWWKLCRKVVYGVYIKWQYTRFVIYSCFFLNSPLELTFWITYVIKHKNIINFIRAQRLGWLGHIERMQETRMVKAIYCWKPISRRPIGRPKMRWVNDGRKDIHKLKVPNWKTLVQDRRRWKELVEKAETIHNQL